MATREEAEGQWSRIEADVLACRSLIEEQGRRQEAAWAALHAKEDARALLLRRVRVALYVAAGAFAAAAGAGVGVVLTGP